MNRALALGAAAVSLLGCQNYDLERVTPQGIAVSTDHSIIAAHRARKNVMFLVDQSASMNTRIDLTDPTAPTRLDEVKAACIIALRNPRSLSRFGLSAFPTGSQSCGTESTLKLDLPAPMTADDDASLTAHAEATIAALQTLSPQGGTPTAQALEQLAMNQGLIDSSDQRDDLVVLITDGLPNCNATNPNNLCTCGSACSIAAINACACTGSTCSQSTCSLGCLDDQGAIAAIDRLKSLNVRTAVLGFGAELTDAASAAVLNAMAIAGGHARTCDGSVCDRAFYAANNRDELSKALEDLVGQPNCEFSLSKMPSDAAHLEVTFEGVITPSGPATWEYDKNRNLVRLLGGLCERASASTDLAPVDLQLRVAERY